MIVRRGTGDLNRIYRPCRIDEIFGNEIAKRLIKNALEQGTVPQVYLLTGPSGCGKTTAARVVAMYLNCRGTGEKPCCECPSCRSILNLNSFAVMEIDASRTSSVDVIRSALDDLPAASLGGERYKVLVIDEAHNLSGKAEDALLKFMEDTPPDIHIILCTNEPQKLKAVTINRCKQVQFGRLTDNEIYNLLEQVSQFEGFDYKKDILQFIAEEVEGVPRAALSALQMISTEGSWTKENATVIINSGVDIENADVFAFCKILLKGNWAEVKESFLKIKALPAETIRLTICGFLAGCVRNARTYEAAELYANMVEKMSYLYYGPKPVHILFAKICMLMGMIRKANAMNASGGYRR